MRNAGRAALIVNTRSRRGARLYADARRALEALGYTVDGRPVRDPDRLETTAAEALRRMPDVLVLGGGDGTISSVVDLLVGRSVPLAVLPLGTANSFARSIGVPLDLDEAINLIAAGRRRRIDLGRIGEDCFANLAAIGLAPRIAETIPHWLKKWGGRLGYAVWALLQLFRFDAFRVEIGGEKLWAVEVRIANGSHQGGAEVAADAEVDSGDVLVQVIPGRSRFALLRSWTASLIGWVQPELLEIRVRRCTIVTDPPQPISIDGEVLARTPAVASVLANAIEIFAPPQLRDAPCRELSPVG